MILTLYHMDAGTYENGYEYLRLGSDRKGKIMLIPGLNDELVRSTDYPLLLRYYFRNVDGYEINVVSRKRGLEEDVTTRKMAEAYREVLREEGSMHVVGISLGGMIAQHLADISSRVEKLVLGFSGVRLGEQGVETIERWRKLAENVERKKLQSEVLGDSFYGWKRLLTKAMNRGFGRKVSAPSIEDFRRSSQATLQHDSTETAGRIENDTLIVAGRKDSFFPDEIISETANRIGARSRYIDGGHISFLEKHSDFLKHMNTFLND